MAELRQIGTLRLRASRRDQVARTAIALEDALRTASLPQLPRGAILLVRRLDLGRLPANASPQWLSRHIEARLRALQLAVRAPRDDKPSAAPLVWFADRSEALAALLAASLHDAPRAWYWAGVLPGWRPGMILRELLPRALRQAEATAGAAGVAALLDRLLRLDRLDPVLDHLDPTHVLLLSGSTGAPAASVESIAMPRQAAPEPRRIPQPLGDSEGAKASPPPGSSEAPVPAIASDHWHAALRRWVRRWGAADQRSCWLAAQALIAVHGPAAAAHAERLVAHLAAAAAKPRTDPIEGQPARPLGDEPEPARSAVPPAPHKVLGNARADAVTATEPDWQPSRHGGLLLILPALARLEIAKADPDGDLCLSLLHRIADRLRIRKDDAIRRALPKPLPREEPRVFVPPDAWRGLRLPRGIDLGRESCLLVACQLVLARYLRRYASISLRRLVRRPALVCATRTHIDLRFDACWVEMKVRLAGLDLDPGWVPWLGRVVSFHYDYEGQP
jgi:hypothetical protein